MGSGDFRQSSQIDFPLKERITDSFQGASFSHRVKAPQAFPWELAAYFQPFPQDAHCSLGGSWVPLPLHVATLPFHREPLRLGIPRDAKELSPWSDC